MLTSANLERPKVFDALFSGYAGPAFSIRLWDGWQWSSSTQAEPRCSLTFNSPRAFEALVLRPSEITLGEAFLAGDIDVDGDLFSVFAVTEHIFHCPQGRRRKLLETLSRVLFEIARWWNQPHSVERDRTAISHHYDQPVEFFRPWLGESLVYSCAYFRSPADDLATAQANKLELVCGKLRLRPGDRFLDIGCGWGSLVLHAASQHQANAQGITISQEQAAVAAARIREAELEVAQSCSAELLDYRNAPGRFMAFDKIASLGMFEHVGMKNLPRYFRTVYGLLRPRGLFLNHGIAHAQSSPPRDARPDAEQHRDRALFARSIDAFLNQIPPLRRARNSSFIDKYVFPDGELVTLSEAMQAAESAGFEVRDVENLREHYELTLRAWVENLQRNAGQLLRQVSQTTYRTWLLYLAGSVAAFHRGDIAVYQMLLSRPDGGPSGLPLTREDLYAPGT
ncbi:MAG TPA: cyclopropane-fatty-acyl-phospholipid synthase family protein [Granulicella sp.]|nr:cyclopropane-fatty-acyl-phospholipid synthase family protein [Granulicella sp.]